MLLHSRRFHVSEAGVRAIAREARAKGVGARGLRSILEKLLLEAMFHVSGGGLVKGVVRGLVRCAAGGPCST